MKICVISTTIMTLPPPGYSGLEQLAWQIAGGLAGLKHQVLLVAPVGSAAPAGVELHGTTLGEAERQAWLGYRDRLKDWDVIVDHSWQKWAYESRYEGFVGGPRGIRTPVLGVCHAPVGTMYRGAPPMPRPCLVCISNDQAEEAKQLWGVDVRVAYNGIDTGFYKPAKGVKRGDRYLFLARFSRIKGAHIALDVAQAAGVGLDLVGDDKITGEAGYSQECRMRAVGPIKYHGPATREACAGWFSQAKALLHMNQLFREPFGLAPVEAQSCGCPVIAFDNGAMRETVKPGETGFLVKTPDEVVKLVKDDAVARLSPKRCREWAGQFSVGNMIKRYEELCKEAIEEGW